MGRLSAYVMRQIAVVAGPSPFTGDKENADILNIDIRPEVEEQIKKFHADPHAMKVSPKERAARKRGEEARHELRELVRSGSVAGEFEYLDGPLQGIERGEWEASAGKLWLNYAESFGGFSSREDGPEGEVWLDAEQLDQCLKKMPSIPTSRTEQKKITSEKHMRWLEMAEEIAASSACPFHHAEYVRPQGLRVHLTLPPQKVEPFVDQRLANSAEPLRVRGHQLIVERDALDVVPIDQVSDLPRSRAMQLGDGNGRGDGRAWSTYPESPGEETAFDADFASVDCDACRLLKGPNGRWQFEPCQKHLAAWDSV